jgi:hypothetical protein
MSVFEDAKVLQIQFRTAAQNSGVILHGLSPRVDMQRQSVGTGALSLHENNVPCAIREVEQRN